jgi:Kef-type K+ transport system membrane component KefB
MLAFTLFIGAAMSVTAFPVLARIITDRNLQQTPLGSLALTCASIDDICAWLLLAAAIAVTRTDSMEAALPTAIYLVVFILLMVTVGRKLMRRVARYYNQAEDLPQWLLTLIFICVLLSAIVTEWIGIDVIFGGFLLGVMMPKNARFTEELMAKTQTFMATFLLPIFFAYSGLNTHFGLVNTAWLWAVSLMVMAAAIIGKYCGVYVAARSCGVDQAQAKALGWLMNTRGLTELIVLNIGLKLKVISPVVFSIFVMMALVTTIMASPLVERVYSQRRA